jgi:hypothetical protein
VSEVREYQECILCLENSKGERHTELAWIGPLKDVHVCSYCDLLT